MPSGELPELLAVRILSLSHLVARGSHDPALSTGHSFCRSLLPQRSIASPDRREGEENAFDWKELGLPLGFFWS
jgi:hypothetical protein